MEKVVLIYDIESSALAFATIPTYIIKYLLLALYKVILGNDCSI